MKYFLGAIGIGIFLCISSAHAAESVELPTLTARGVAIYGWKNEKPVLLYQKNQNYLFPIASITKLVTAKAAEAFYTQAGSVSSVIPFFTTENSLRQPVPLHVYSFEDTLKALLINSNNDAALALSANVGDTAFLAQMQNFLFTNKYTMTTFYNPTGLDPLNTKLPVNRLTPYATMRLMHDIYVGDPLLANTLAQKDAYIQDESTGEIVYVSTSNDLNLDPKYKDRILISKTGRTGRAGENLVFVTPGVAGYDYEVVVLFASKNRNIDGKRVIDWLAKIDEQSKIAENNVKKEVNYSTN